MIRVLGERECHWVKLLPHSCEDPSLVPRSHMRGQL